MELRILGDRVLVEPITPGREMPEGLVAPDSAVPEAEVSGRVVTLGSKYDGPCTFGDVVAFSSVAGQEVAYNGSRYLIIPGPEILAILT